MSINFPAQPCTTLWEHLFYSRLNWWWKSLKMLMEQGVLTHACNPNTWGARVGEPGVHAPHQFFGSRLTEEEDLPIFSWRKTHPSRPPICFWKSSHGGRGPTSLLMEEASSFDSWKKIYIWSGCRKKSPLWRLIGFRPLWKQIDPSYSLLARLITSVAAQSHYWALFFFSPLSFTIE